MDLAFSLEIEDGRRSLSPDGMDWSSEIPRQYNTEAKSDEIQTHWFETREEAFEEFARRVVVGQPAGVQWGIDPLHEP